MRILTAVLITVSVTLNAAAYEKSAGDVNPLDVGAAMPDATLTTLDGSDVSLKEAVGSKPALLIFYRGGWCPYCMRHLSALREVIPLLKEMHYTVLAISPDYVESAKSAAEESGVKYTVLTDSNFEAIQAFDLAFALDEETLEKYDGYGINLKPQADSDEFILPVPAVYLVNADGTIVFRHYDPDYKERLAPEKILEAARTHSNL